jgi:nucleotide-binding universal stress UspA family protein
MSSSTTPRRRFRIVTALDGSEYAEIVLEHALDQAARHENVDLHFLSVAKKSDDVARVKARLAELVFHGLELEPNIDWHARLHVRVGDATEEIANLAGELDADLLVVGRFGLHPSRHHDSTADRVIERVSLPILVIGLGEHFADTQPQCAECVAVREATDGERWFCAEHSSPDRLDLTMRLPPSTTSVLGGPLW